MFFPRWYESPALTRKYCAITRGPFSGEALAMFPG